MLLEMLIRTSNKYTSKMGVTQQEVINIEMPYRISKADIDKIADILPDAYVLDDNGETVEVVLQGAIDSQTAAKIFSVVNEDNIEEYRKARRQQFLDEVREVQSFKTNVKKRALCAIVNDAVNSIRS